MRLDSQVRPLQPQPLLHPGNKGEPWVDHPAHRFTGSAGLIPLQFLRASPRCAAGTAAPDPRRRGTTGRTPPASRHRGPPGASRCEPSKGPRKMKHPKYSKHRIHAQALPTRTHNKSCGDSRSRLTMMSVDNANSPVDDCIRPHPCKLAPGSQTPAGVNVSSLNRAIDGRKTSSVLPMGTANAVPSSCRIEGRLHGARVCP